MKSVSESEPWKGVDVLLFWVSGLVVGRVCRRTRRASGVV